MSHLEYSGVAMTAGGESPWSGCDSWRYESPSTLMIFGECFLLIQKHQALKVLDTTLSRAFSNLRF